MTVSKLRCGACLWLLVMILTAANAMAVQIVMKVDGVDGETCLPDHDKWICVQSASVGAGVACTTPAGGPGNQRECGKPSLSDFSATILQTSASPQLLAKLVKGAPVPTVEIEWWDQGPKGMVNVATMKLEDVRITSLSSSGAAGGEVVESVSFQYGKVTSTVWARNEDGSLGDPETTCWDIETNDSC